MKEIKIFLSGCNGRMGKVITEIVAEQENMTIAAGSDLRDENTEFPVFSNAADGAEIDFDVIIDFSHISALPDVIALATRTQKPVVFCTTGFSESQQADIRRLSTTVPVFYSGNMSLGINLLMVLAQKAASILYPEFDIEIIEAHHSKKLDAPSGTALMLANAVNQAADNKLEYIYERESVRRERAKSELGIHSIRCGSIIGEHSVIFAGPEETVTLSHSAQSRTVFARGAVAAARFMPNQAAGLYTMTDLIGGV